MSAHPMLRLLREKPSVLELTGQPQSIREYARLFAQAYMEWRRRALGEAGEAGLTAEEEELVRGMSGEEAVEWFEGLPEEARERLRRLAPAKTEFYLWLQRSPEFRVKVAEEYKRLLYEEMIEEEYPELSEEEVYQWLMSLPPEERQRITGIAFEEGGGEVKVTGPGKIISPLKPPQEADVVEARVEADLLKGTLTGKVMGAELPEPLKSFAAGFISEFEALAYMLLPKHPMHRTPLIGEGAIGMPPTVSGAGVEALMKAIGVKREAPQYEAIAGNPAYIAGGILGAIASAALVGKAIERLSKAIAPRQLMQLEEYVEYTSGGAVKRAIRGRVVDVPEEAVKPLKPEEVIGVRIKAVEWSGDALAIGVKDVYGEQFAGMLGRTGRVLQTAGPEEWVETWFTARRATETPVESYAAARRLEQVTAQWMFEKRGGVGVAEEALLMGAEVKPTLTYGKITGVLTRGIDEAVEAGWRPTSFRGGGAAATITSGIREASIKALVEVPKPTPTSRLTAAAAAAITLSPAAIPRAPVKWAAESPIMVEEAAAEPLKIGVLGISTPKLTLKAASLRRTVEEAPPIAVETVGERVNKYGGAVQELLLEKPKPQIQVQRMEKVLEKPPAMWEEQPEKRRPGAKWMQKALKAPGEREMQAQLKKATGRIRVAGITLAAGPPRKLGQAKGMRNVEEVFTGGRRRRGKKYMEFINPFPEIKLFGGGRRGRGGAVKWI